MSESKNPVHGGVDQYADWEIFLPLVADDADQAGFRIKDAPGGESHRLLITGYDRPNATAVRGRLYHVVHGIMGNSSGRPATLIVFEWLLVPGDLGHRFRQVDIDVRFAASGSRLGKKPGADLSAYTPEVAEVAPNVPMISYISGRDVTEETEKKAALSLGYAPYATVSPEISGKSTQVTARTDYRFVAGYPALVHKSWGEPNSVHWTLQENAPQESGAPHLLRTAVLVRRRAGDYGTFTASIATSVNVSLGVNMSETLRKLVGLVPKDDPVSFDPKTVDDVKDGAVVLYGSKEVAHKESPCDKNNLGAANLAKFLVEDEDDKWRVNKAPLDGKAKEETFES